MGEEDAAKSRPQRRLKHFYPGFPESRDEVFLYPTGANLRKYSDKNRAER